MAKSSTERHMDWRNRVTLKARIFDDLNAERAARIRQAFPGDDRPEVRAVVEFFANYPRCQHAPRLIDLRNGTWCVDMDPWSATEAICAYVALEEASSLPVTVNGLVPLPSERASFSWRAVVDEVAEMRALGLWGRS